MAAAERVSATLAGQVTRPAIVDQGASYSYIIHMGATRLFSDPTPENKGEIHLKGQKCLKLECRSGAWASQVPEVRTLAYFKGIIPQSAIANKIKGLMVFSGRHPAHHIHQFTEIGYDIIFDLVGFDLAVDFIEKLSGAFDF